jgi:signal transduction histidine kinase
VSPTSPETPTWVRRALRVAIGAGLFIAAGYLGRATVIGGHGLSLIWPAIGVAGLWIGSGNRRTWPADVLALIGSTMLVTMTTGANLPIALVFAATNVVQVFAFVMLLRRWSPSLWGLGGTEDLHRVADLGRISTAAAFSGIAGLSIGAIGITATIGMPSLATLAVWWGRNTVALIVITVLGILIGQPLSRARGRRTEIFTAALTPLSAKRAIEAGALIGGTASLSVLIFGNTTTQPLAFLLLATSVWAGLRFASVAVTLHGVGMGICGIAFTLAGQGPFVAATSLPYRALVAQCFVAMSVLTGLALSFSRAERDAAYRDLVEARRAADERAQLLGAVLETMQEGVVVVEDGGQVLVRNAAARDLVGMPENVPDTLRTASEYGLFRANGLPLTDDELPAMRALAGQVVPPEDLHVRAPSVPLGRVLEISAQPLASNDPNVPRRAMVNLRDVTVDRQHRDALASFAGAVAHDLFNPLTIVDGWAEALADEFRAGPVSPMIGSEMVERIHDAAEHMRMFIADLMSYTIARDQSLRYGPVDLTEIVRSLAALRSHSPSEPLIVVASGLTAWADAGLVRQLLDNLIGNAIKYVAPGVRPMIEVTGHAEGDWLVVRVADNGIGIPVGEREAVFESLHRAHGDRFGGTGLGLAICRRIVDRHGGTIQVAPVGHGTGSVFTFRLPRVAVSSEPGGFPVLAPLSA